MSYNIEDAYLQIANACDQVSAEERELFLAKLVLVMADQIKDLSRLQDSIKIAKLDLQHNIGSENGVSQ